MGFEPEAMDCTAANLDYVKFLYKSNIEGINDAVRLYKESHPGYDMKSLANYIYTPFLNKVADSAKCLEDLGVDPNSVYRLSNDSRQVMEYDPGKLEGIAPLFVQYVPIPEFGLSMAVLAVAFVAAVAWAGRHGIGAGKPG